MGDARQMSGRPRNAVPFRISLTLAAVFVMGWWLGPSGRVHGIEFSPDRFSHRSFRYYQWCGIQFTPKQVREWRSAVDEYIHQSGFVGKSDSPRVRWHLVKGFAPWRRGWHGGAKHLCQSVGCWGDDNHWVEWSRAHPALAEIVWPQVVTWARDERYGQIRVLFSWTALEKAAKPDDVRERIRHAEAEGERYW